MKIKFQKTKSVLIGYVFGFSAENVNIPFPYAWIISLLVGFGSFLSVRFCCEFSLRKNSTLQKPCESPVKSCFQPCLHYFRAVNWL